MKHLIIVNKNSASSSSKDEFIKSVKKAFSSLDYEIYETPAPKAVISYLKEYLTFHKDEVVRVYACGGDGTAHEVANGLFGFSNAELAIIPIGTGNDFVKYYGDKEKFLNLNNMD